jgi:membrane protein implicated in regulation of membrane protease activity
VLVLSGGGGNHSEVGLFSIVRWGVGGTIIVIGGTVTASVLLALWFRYHTLPALLLSALTYAVVAVVAFVKITEEIQPTRHIDESVVGKVGVVVSEPTPSKPGVVKIGSQLWSAKAYCELKTGDKVVVRSREGLYLVVEKTSNED